MKAVHPCKGLPSRQRAVFERVAVNEQPSAPKALKALEAKGLVVAAKRVLPGPTPVEITEYRVPLHIHMQWCEWVSERWAEEHGDELIGDELIVDELIGRSMTHDHG